MKLWTQWLQAVRFLRPACHRSLTFLSIGPCQGAAGPPLVVDRQGLPRACVQQHAGRRI